MQTIFPRKTEVLNLAILFYVNHKTHLPVAETIESPFKELLGRKSIDLTFWRTKVSVEINWSLPVGEPSRRSFREQLRWVEKYKENYPKEEIKEIHAPLLLLDLGDKTLDYLNETFGFPLYEGSSDLYIFMLAWSPRTLIDLLDSQNPLDQCAFVNLYGHGTLRDIPNLENLEKILEIIDDGSETDDFEKWGLLNGLSHLSWNRKDGKEQLALISRTTGEYYNWFACSIILESLDLDLADYLLGTFSLEDIPYELTHIFDRLAEMRGRDFSRVLGFFKALFCKYREHIPQGSLGKQRGFNPPFLEFLQEIGEEKLIGERIVSSEIDTDDEDIVG